MFQISHRPTKIKFAMELKKRKRSVSPPSSSNLRNPKRRATLLQVSDSDSPVARLFNDKGIKALVRETYFDDAFVQNGKKFLFSLQRIVNDSPEECANDIYDKACQLWEFEEFLMSSCTYAIDAEPCFSDTLLTYANNDTPQQRMASMMKDPWLEYVLELTQCDCDFLRGLLSIIIAYWNMKDLLDKYHVSDYGHERVKTYVPPINVKEDEVTYDIDHVQDFRNLREVLESKFSSDPELLASLFEEIKKFQVHGYLAHLWTCDHLWTSGNVKRARITVCLKSEGSCPLSLIKPFVFCPLSDKKKMFGLALQDKTMI